MDEVSERGVGDGEENQPYDSQAQQTIANSSYVNSSTLDGGNDERKLTGGKLNKWQPNDSYLETLLGMGFNRQSAIKALYYTSNSSVELATSWLLENPHADLAYPYDSLDSGSSTSPNQMSPVNDIYKMVFVVNSSLEMGIGKTAAQVAHSALGMHMLLLQDEPKYGEAIMKWFEYGETKIVLKGDSTSHLIQLEKKALSIGLPTYLVQDAGKTQVPVGSITALCIFGRVDQVDKVTGTLRLL